MGVCSLLISWANEIVASPERTPKRQHWTLNISVRAALGDSLCAVFLGFELPAAVVYMLIAVKSVGKGGSKR
tara:strand:+ start:33935 stop:34150 length:216 start_codon:yes stop_codon:yes gene_type:complete